MGQDTDLAESQANGRKKFHVKEIGECRAPLRTG